ncbi:MAG: YggS family pyridoxal phosphate-dependent enzyme [Bacillota bacterium]|nr:YggS family pyridoxal phosphate-dependent enzyme [Bacillota bacterium]MDW7676455.1 YggS family pyridoxal phosphate-dependent enzyme [Bacillota bacterium]
MSVALNYQTITKKIEEACLVSGRQPGEVNVIAVSKLVTIKQMKEAISIGINHFGENKVQDMMEKMKAIDAPVNWHMIGHLQRNKVKYIVDNVSLIHSVDSLSLIQEIERQALKINRVVDCLIQVNVSGEASKFGIDPTEIDSIMESLEGLEKINVVGLMTMAPHYDDPEKTRDSFKRLSFLFETCQEKAYHGTHLKYLSMGMSNDYEIAVQEGANMVRIGSALFGERNYG